jgi:hypothetical protein
MKNLEEKKKLAQLARAFGQPDLDLEESIRKEESLTEQIFGVISKPVPLVEEKLFEVKPPPAVEIPPKEDQIQTIANAIKPSNPLTRNLKDAEIEGIRRTLSEMTQKISTLSWGGGGTGVVTIGATDDFDKVYQEGSYLRWKDGMFRLDSSVGDALAATGEPMGFVQRTDSVISFDNVSRTFTISPVSTSYEIWTKGIKRTIYDTRSVTIPNNTGLYYIYFDTDGELQYRTSFFDWPNDCMTAYVYWNQSTSSAPFVADERHGVTLDWQTHEYLHRTRGAAIASGFNAGNYILLGDASSNSHIQLDISSGTFFDEDLQVDIVATNTPVANTWDQDLSGPARIPMFYLSGTSWVIDSPTDFPVKKGTTRPQYNYFNGTSWSTADIDNNKFGVTFIVATNNINYPVIGIIGQSSHANQGDAEAAQFSDLTLTGFPVVEMRVLYKMVYDCKDAYSNYVKARLVSLWDLRNFQSVASVSATVADHGLLTGLSDDDHPQYKEYVPAVSSNWNAPAPTTIASALDRLAALVKTLNGGTGA